MDGTRRRDNARTPQQRSSDQKTEEEEKSKDGTQTQQAGALARTMRRLMKTKKKSGRKSGSSTSTTTTKSSSSRRHRLVSEHTQARAPTTKRSGGEKVDVKELRAVQTTMAAPQPGPDANKKIPNAGQTVMAFTVFENDKLSGGAQMAACRPEKEAKLQWRSAETERERERDEEEGGAGLTIPDDNLLRTPVKKKEKSKQRNKSLDSPGPPKAKTPMSKVSPGGRPKTPNVGRTPSRTPARTPL